MADEQLAEAMRWHELGDLSTAATLYRRILAENDQHPDAWNLLAMVLAASGQTAAALEHAERAIQLSPKFADYHNNFATIQFQAEQFDEAEASCRRAIELRSDFPQAHNNLGNALLAQGRYAEALAAYHQALGLRPAYPLALANAAHALRRLGRYEEAIQSCQQALQLDSSSAEAWNNLGDACLQVGKTEEALDAFQQAQVVRPDSPEILNNLGQACRQSGRSTDAIRCYRRALELRPDDVRALCGLGAVLRETGDLEAAEEAFQKWVSLEPSEATAQNDLGELLYRRDRHEAAIACFRKAVEIQPELAAGHFNLANTLRDSGRLDEAEDSYRRALELQPTWSAPMTNLAITLSDQGGTAEAYEWFSRSVELNPSDPTCLSHQLVCEQYLPGYSRQQILEHHRHWDQLFSGEPSPVASPLGRQGKPLRVGFLSRDFRQHPIAFFLSGLWESLSSKSLQTVAFSDGEQRDPWTERLQKASCEWYEVADRTDDQLTEQIRECNLDVLFDLAGHTAGHRLQVFARRVAPLQISWLGYVGTTGLAAMDGLLTDHFHTPNEWDSDFTEKLIRMPDGYACYTPPDVDPRPRRASEDQIRLGCFSNPAKLSEITLQMWAQLLKRLPAATLLLKYYGWQSLWARERFLARCKVHGISPDQLEFEGPAPQQEFLQRYCDIDVALDTLPYSGGVTTCEALWMGVPVVTLPGDTFAGRHALSHLSNAGLTELIATDQEDYVERVANLAEDAERRVKYHEDLREQVRQSPLCDSERFAHNLVNTLRQLVS